MNYIDFTAIDFETGSFAPNSVCQVGLARVTGGVITEMYTSLIKPPGNYIWKRWTEELHHISYKDTKHAPEFAESYTRWKHLVENQIIVAHNMNFDYRCLSTCLREFCGYGAETCETLFKRYCTCKTWKGAFHKASLEVCCEELKIELFNHHNALADAEACARLFIAAQECGRELKG